MKSSFKIGDIITLKWNGYKGVPMYLNYSKAIIQNIKTKRIIVKASNNECYSITLNQII